MIRRVIPAACALLLPAIPALAQVDTAARGIAVTADRRTSSERSLTEAAGIGGYAEDRTVQIQDGLFAAQMQWRRLTRNGMGYADILPNKRALRYKVDGIYCVSSPIVVPENVELDGTLVRCDTSASTTGAATTYAGDPGSKALGNYYQPMVVVPPLAAYGRLTVLNHTGSQTSSGVAVGKNWVTTGVSVAAGGSGYTDGDVLTVANPSRGPYQAATCTATVSAGAVTACTQTRPGYYALPPLLQRRYWTAANGFAQTAPKGGYATMLHDGAQLRVFANEGTGTYITDGGTGTGATVSLAYRPDFAGNGSDYDMGAYLDMGMRLGSFTSNVHQGGINSATFGHDFGWASNGLGIIADAVQTNGSYYGLKAASTDTHINQVLPISAEVLLRVTSGGSMEIGTLVLDSWRVAALQVDNYVGFVATNCRAFHNNWAVNSATASPIQIGQVNTNYPNYGIDLRCAVEAGNAMAAPVQVAALANLHNSKIDLSIINSNQSGALVTNPFSGFAAFGSNVASSVVLRGSCDQGCRTTFTGPVPAADIAVYNAGRHTVDTGPVLLPVNAVTTAGAFGGASWNRNGATVADGTTAGPNGAMTAATVTYTNSNDFLRTQITAPAGATLCAQEWVKSTGTNAYAGIALGSVTFDRAASTVANSTGGDTYGDNVYGGATLLGKGMVDYGNGWSLLYLHASVGVANPYLIIQNPPYAASGSFYLWHPIVQVNPRTCPVTDPGQVMVLGGQP